MNDQLEIIRHYFDTTGVRLSADEKDLLCMVLTNPGKYDGFETEPISMGKEEGRDPYHGRWDAEEFRRYRIDIYNNAMTVTCYSKRYVDGGIDSDHWEPDNPFYVASSIRDVLRYLTEIERYYHL